MKFVGIIEIVAVVMIGIRKITQPN